MKELPINVLDDLTWYILDKCYSVEVEFVDMRVTQTLPGFKENTVLSKVILERIAACTHILNNLKKQIQKDLT